MARSYHLSDAFNSLASLYADEHSEGDDEGVRQVDGLLKGLKAFKAHEDQEAAQRAQLLNHARTASVPAQMREATYDLGDGRHVYYQSSDTLKDAADLWTVLDEDAKTGSPNIENVQAQGLLEHLQSGGALSEAQIGLLQKLLAKHAPAIAGLRSKGDSGADQMLNPVDVGPESRIVGKAAA